MKIVRKSKEPSVQQMLNMASNLQEKFKKYSTIESKSVTFSSGESKQEFRFYVADIDSDSFNSWSKLQAYYFGLMK